LRISKHEATADLNLSEAKEQNLADILKELAQQLNLSPVELRREIEKWMPEPEDHDPADWWKE
jgi:hypothetical protein